MRTGGRLILIVFVLAPFAIGCRSSSHEKQAAQALPPELPTAERRLTPIDVSQVTDTPSIRTDAPPAYHALAAEECRRLACAHAGLANLIERAADDSTQRRSFWLRENPADALRTSLASHLSREARNRTAGAALELYFRLLEAELLSDALTATQTEMDALIAIAAKTADAGFKESADLLQLRKQQVELRADQARLRSGIARLNAELKSLLHLDATAGNLLPTDTIQVPPEPLDANQAVRIGLAARADLQALRTLIAGLDTTTLGAVRQALVGLVPPLGAVTTATRVLAPGLQSLLQHLAKPEVESLRRQLQTHLADREREVTKDIRSAVDEWTGARELVAIAKRRLIVETERVAELKVKRDAGVAVEAEYRRATLDVMRAEADIVREAAKWKLADVKARQTMGILCLECSPPTPRADHGAKPPR